MFSVTRLSVVGFGKMRKDGTRGSKVKLALETQGTSAVRIRVHAPREAAVLDTRFRLSATQVRREDALYQEDPRAEVRGGSELDQSGRAGQSGRHVRAKHKPWLNDLSERAPTSMRMLGLILGRHDL